MVTLSCLGWASGSHLIAEGVDLPKVDLPRMGGACPEFKAEQLPDLDGGQRASWRKLQEQNRDTVNSRNSPRGCCRAPVDSKGLGGTFLPSLVPVNSGN